MNDLLTDEELTVARDRRLDAMHLQLIENNPFDKSDIAMFEMFERKRWSHEKRREYIAERCRQLAINNPPFTMSDPYVYPETKVLRNRFDITDAKTLDEAERRNVGQRLAEECPRGDFDLQHLKSIHHHLFQDVYQWAGEIRTVHLGKRDCTFLAARFIETGMSDVHSRLQSQNYLKEMDSRTFANEAARIIGDVNYIHPFREGNGRTQMQYLKQLAQNAGHSIDLQRIEPDQWVAASVSANQGDYHLMARTLGHSLTEPKRSHEAGHSRVQGRGRGNDGERER